MNVKLSLITAALGLGFAGMTAADAMVMSKPEVRAIVTRAGYAEPLVLEWQDPLWQVRSTDAGSGSEVTLYVNAEGEILGAADVARKQISETDRATVVRVGEPIDEAQVTAVLVDAGFHNVHDVDFEGDHWKAEADDVSGEDFEVHVDSYSGRIVHVEDD